MIDGQIRNIARKKTLWETIVLKKFSVPIVIVFLFLTAIAVSYLIAKGGLVIGIVILCAVIGLPIAYAVVAYPVFGIITLISVSFFINYVSRFLPDDLPIGLVMDALTYLLILGFFVRQKREHDWTYFNNPITYFIAAWIGYNLIEVINPASVSILAWVYTVRTVGFIMLMYFVFVFNIRTKSQIKLILKVWLILVFIAGVAGFQQENIGLFPFEKAWLHAEPLRFGLLFIAGHLRKWGIFSDPVVYAYNMVAAMLICIALILGNLKTGKKIVLGLLAFFYVMVMLYSGTRASYVMIPAGLVMLTILKFNKKLLAGAIVVGLMLAFLIVVPTSNATLARFQSAFMPSKDASFNVRAENQARIRPYILSHPIGGGLGSVGIWGQRFAPNSFLAKFPPDSGYVRVAVEMGWVGLLLFCTFNFVVLYKGCTYYFLIKDPELKTYCLAMLLFLFAFDIGNYAQQAIVQYPSNILFYLSMALLNVVMRLDLQQRNLLAIKKEIVPMKY